MLRPRHLFRSLAAVLVFSACPKLDAAPDAFVPSTTSKGALVHRDSGFSFPDRLDGFTRINPHQFDPAGRDVSVGYNRGTLPPIVATIYVYPTGGLNLEQEFARRQSEVTHGHSAAQLLATGATVVSPGKARALRAEYAYKDRFGGANLPLRSVLMVAQKGPRFVEYRFSYPEGLQTSAAPLVKKLAQDYAWP